MREGLRSNSRRSASTERRMFDLNKVPVEAEDVDVDVGAASSAYYSAQGEQVDPRVDVDVSSNAGGDLVLGQGVDAGTSLDVVALPTQDANIATGVEVDDGASQPRTRGRKRKLESSAPVKVENVASEAVNVGGNVSTEHGSKRRGRKKKEQGGQEANLTLEAAPQTVGRVLRSRGKLEARPEAMPQTVGRVLRSRTKMGEASASDKQALPEKIASASEKQGSPEKEANDAEEQSSPEKEEAATTDKLALSGKQPDVTDTLDLSEAKAIEMQALPGKKAGAAVMQPLPEKEADGSAIQALPEKLTDTAELLASRWKDDHSDMELDSPHPTEEGKTPAEKESQLVIKKREAAAGEKESQFVIEEGVAAPAGKKLKRGRGRPPKKLGATEEGKTPAEKENQLVIKKGEAAAAEKESQLVIGEGVAAPAEKKVKRGRGRPPKKLGADGTVIQSLSEKTDAAEMLPSRWKDDHSDMELDSPPSTEEGKTPEKESQLVIEEGVSAPAEKKLKRGRGRPPKKLGADGSVNVTDTVSNKAQIDHQKKKISMPGAKVVKGQKGVKLHKKVVTSVNLQSQNNMEKKEGGMSLREEKHLLKERITSILFNAGWTVEYRPRLGRDYNDAVYLDAKGRTHWSVTLAYSRLEKKIEDGTADDKEISAFSPIPQDEICKLFRVTKGGTKSKKGENGSESSRKRTGKKQGGSKRKMKGINGEQEKSSSRKPTSRKGGGRRPCGLSARESKVELEDGKLTVLSWMIDLGTISPGDKVLYMNHERIDATYEGKIAREGICCDCCDKVFSIADFEVHIGSSQGQPLLNICLESGRSLLQCMSESWSKQEQIHRVGFNFVNVENDPDDDTCNICADGGDLICCDGCPSTFHQTCLQIENMPTGDWHCIYCACKYCGIICNENSEGSNVRDPDDSGHFTCLFCEEKFHVKCMLRKEKKNMHVEGLQFCSSGCQKLSENLHKLLGVKHELENGFSWTILRRQDLATSDPLKIECNCKLAIAHSVIDECFNPINDERSNTNMIQNICYSCGSNVRRLNYSGFCTFILEKSDELIAAATIRIHGNRLAEMPFIGTRGIYRRKGMCRRLLTAIETVLSSLDVEKLVIPAISELLETWTKVFGFVPLEESGRREMKHMSLVLFPHMNMLQKPLQQDQAREDLLLPLSDHTNAKVGYGPCRVNNRLVEFITPSDELCHAFGTSEATSKSGHKRISKDEMFHGLDKYEPSLETSKSGTLEENHLEHCACAHDDVKDALQSSQKPAVC